jgi:hypothetical protein
VQNIAIIGAAPEVILYDVISQVKFVHAAQVRDALNGKSERWSDDIAGYARLNQSVVATMKVISESLRRGKRPLTREQALADLKVRLLGGEPP